MTPNITIFFKTAESWLLVDFRSSDPQLTRIFSLAMLKVDKAWDQRCALVHLGYQLLITRMDALKQG